MQEGRCLVQAEQAAAAADSDSEGELFVPKSRKRRREEGSPLTSPSAADRDPDADDSVRFAPSAATLAAWAQSAGAERLRDRFVTGELQHGLPADAVACFDLPVLAVAVLLLLQLLVVLAGSAHSAVEVGGCLHAHAVSAAGRACRCCLMHVTPVLLKTEAWSINPSCCAGDWDAGAQRDAQDPGLAANGSDVDDDAAGDFEDIEAGVRSVRQGEASSFHNAVLICRICLCC